MSQLVASLADCLLDPVTYDDHLGRLDRNASYFCTLQTQRLPPGVFCCTPQNSDKLRLLVSTPSGGEREIKFYDDDGARVLQKEHKVVYLAHGWMDKIQTSPWVNQTR